MPGSAQWKRGAVPETITIESLNGNGEKTELEVPYDPQRIAILDMASLDILDSLGLVESVRSNVSVIASMFGKEAEIEELMSSFEERIQKLADFADKKTAIVGMCTSGSFNYLFVMDRDAAIGTDGAQLAKEIVENELVMDLDVYKNGNIVYLAHPAVWYTAEGGIQALDIMLQDLESELFS